MLLDKEIQQNFEAFQKILPDLIKKHIDEYVLMRHKKVIAIYSTAFDAVQTGEHFYEDGIFSVQKIISQPIDLGFFSRVMPIR